MLSFQGCTCKVDPGAAPEMTPHQLAQVVAARPLMEPLGQPHGLVSHQDCLIVRLRAFICYSCKVPAGEL